VRAYDPWPGTATTLQGTPLKVLAATVADGAVAAAPPGTVLDARLTVACGSGTLRLTRVQAGGRAALPAETFLRGHPIPAGTRLGG
jgi:methionyl-tRNA formyltransferase